MVDQPIVKRAVGFKLQGADAVGDAFQGIGIPMSHVVDRVNAPFVARPVMRNLLDPVDHRVAQVHVGRRHVDLRAQGAGTILEFPGPHPGEKIQIFLRRPGAVRAVGAGFGQSAAGGTDFLHRQITDVGESFGDQFERKSVDLVKVVAGMEKVGAPVKTEPSHVFLDALHIFNVFLGRVGVIEPQMAAGARVFLGQTEVQADGFGMTDVQVTIRFRGETRDNGGVLAGPQILLSDLADKIEGFGGGGIGGRVGHGGKPYPSSEKRPAAKGK